MVTSERSVFEFATSWRRVVPAAVVLALVLRLAWPLADPPRAISWSSGVYTDPPANTLPARYAVEHGDPERVRVPERLVYPLLNHAARIFYAVFGVERRSSVLLAGTLGVLAIVALALALRRGPGIAAATLGVALGAVCFWLVTYSRFLMAEGVAVVLLAVAAGFALGRGRAQFAAGALAATATLLGKFHAIAFVAALVVFSMLRARRVRGAVPVALGAATVALVWFATTFLPHRAEIVAWIAGSSVGAEGTAPKGGDLLGLLLAPFQTYWDAWTFHQFPVLATVGGYFAIRTFADHETMRRRVDDGSALLALWVVSTFAYYTALPYTAPRYFVLTALPLVGCAAVQLAELGAAQRLRLPDLGRARTGIVLGVWMLVFGFGITNALFHYEAVFRKHFLLERMIVTGELGFSLLDEFSSIGRGVVWALGIALGLGGLLAFAGRRIGSGVRAEEKLARAGRRFAVAALGAALIANAGQWIAWATGRTFNLENTKASLAAILPPRAVLLGGFAPLLTEGSGVLAVPLFGSAQRADAISRDEVTHVLVPRPGYADQPDGLFPGLREPLEFLHRFPVAMGRTRTLELYRLPPSALPTGFEETLLERAIRHAREDDLASTRERLAEYRRAGGARTAEVLLYEAVCEMEAGDFDAARASLERAAGVSPEHPFVRFNLALLARRRGDLEEARLHARRGLFFDPKNEALAKMLRELSR